MSPTNKSYVSIQLPLGGHSFSGAELEKIEVDGSTHILAIVDSAKCVVAPRELLNEESLDVHLRAMGVMMERDEVAVCSDEGDIVAVMALNRGCYDMLKAKFAGRVHFTSPLLATPLPEHGSVLHLSGNNLYVRVVNNTLQLMDVVSVESDGDILYTLEQINSVHHIFNMYARAEGDTQRLLKLCKKQFKNLEVCE